MPFCPECRDEFQDWVETCPDCHATLVAELPPAPEPASGLDRLWKTGGSAGSEEPMALLTTSPHRPEAEMWAGILKDAGVRCMVKPNAPAGYDSTTDGVSGMIWPATLSFDVYVLEPDIERAREVLKSITEPVAGEELAREPAAPPEAGPADEQPAGQRRWIATAVGIMDIMHGVICIVLAVAFWTSGALSGSDGFSPAYATVVPIALAVIGVLSVPGGICALQRRNWWLAAAGTAVMVATTSLFGLLLLGGLAISRDEFE